MVMIRRQHWESVQFLIDNGARVDLQDAQGYNVFNQLMEHCAKNEKPTPTRREPNIEIENILGQFFDVCNLQGLDLSALLNMSGTYDGMTPLRYACKQNQSWNRENLIEMLIDAGADDVDTVLIEQVKAGSDDVVRVLLENGQNANHQNAEGETALIKAIELAEESENHQKCLEVLMGQFRYNTQMQGSMNETDTLVYGKKTGDYGIMKGCLNSTENALLGLKLGGLGVNTQQRACWLDDSEPVESSVQPENQRRRRASRIDGDENGDEKTDQ